MQIKRKIHTQPGSGIALALLAALLLAGCGGGGDGPAITANTQVISFGAAPTLTLGGTATVSATASSGLAVSFSSKTFSICTVNSSTGLVTDKTVGTCIIAANQSGNATFVPAAQVTQSIPVIFNPNQTISFGAAPTLTLGGTATVSATATSGLAVSYSSTTTPTVCSVNSNTGLVTDLTTGDCTITANQAGDANYHAATAIQTITVSTPSGTTFPGAPTGVTATAGNASNKVSVSIGGIDSGGSRITGYTVTGTNVNTLSSFTAPGTASPITVTCPSSCAGYAFSVYATNAVGDGTSSAPPVDVITNYNIVETFHEPDTQPNDSIFIGTFTLNSTSGIVSNLQGILSESMTGGLIGYPNDTMTWLTLSNQLSSVSVTLGGVNGLLVTTFMLNTTNTLLNNPAFGGTDGWSPGTGGGYYYGYPTDSTGISNPGNAYAMIFVNTADPTAALTQAQIDRLAYADCAPGGMMGGTCMTGTTTAGYGTIGTMSGYPVSQTITKQ
jgi:hypothetical protein